MKTTLCCLALSALALLGTARGGGLADKLSEAGADWLQGTWSGTGPDGHAFTLAYAPVFDGQAGSVHFKSDVAEMKGLIAVDPASGEVRQFAVVSTGELVTGTWDEEGDGLSLSVSWTSADGSYERRTYVHRRVDAETAAVTVYAGPRWSSDTPRHEIELKRVP